MSFIFDRLFNTKKKSEQGNSRHKAKNLAGPSYYRLGFEPLEERTLLAVWLVDQISDSGLAVNALPGEYAGSGELRSVLTAAASGDTIQFDSTVFATPQTITLSSTLGSLTIDKDITIDGENATIDASGANRIFDISDGNNIKSCDVLLMNLHLSNGSSVNGGAVLNEESLTLQNVTITSCNAANGGAIYNLEYGTLNIKDSDFNTNTATANGGAIYNNGKTLKITSSSFTANTAGIDGGALSLDTAADCNAVVTIRDSYFIRNHANGNGGAIHAGNKTDGTLDFAIINSVIHSNTATNGGGIYNNSNNVKTTVVDSTVSLNTTSTQDGGTQIVDNKGMLCLINDIVIGTVNAKTREIFNEDSGSLFLYGSTVGESFSISGITQWGLITGAKAEDVFVSTDAAQTDLQIKANGLADINGTFSGNIRTFDPNSGNGNFYYLRNNTWYKAGDDTETKQFDSANADGNYGLGSNDDSDAIKEAYTAALNTDVYETPVSRTLLMNCNLYNAGAYVINKESAEELERPSIVVTATEDVFDMYDGQISLREAISYAGTGSLGSTITFDPAVFAAIQTITLGSTLKINKDLTIDGAGKVILDGGNTFTSGVSNKDGVQIMYIAKYETVALNGLTLQNGYSNDGGAVYNCGKLTVNNCTFSGNSAKKGGAVYLDAVNKVAFSAANCTFSGNSAEESGEAIYSYSYTYSWLTKCIVLDNVAVGSSNIELYYCVYNTVSGTWPKYVNSISGKTAAEVLESTALNADGTFHIKADCAAANFGTKLQNDGNGNLQYWDKNAAVPAWVNANTITPFTTAQLQTDQLGVSRLGTAAGYDIYAAGASFAEAQPETPSTIVTTTSDIVNPYDGLISFREAVELYSAAGDTITFTGENGTQNLNSAVKVKNNITIGDGFILSTTDEFDDLLIAENSVENITFENVNIQNGNVNMGAGSISITSGKKMTVGNTDSSWFTCGSFTNNGTVEVAGPGWDCSASDFGNVIYSFADAQVLAGTYNNLTLSGSGDMNASGSVTVDGKLTVVSGVAFDVAGNLTVGSAAYESDFNIVNNGSISLSGDFTYTGENTTFGNFTYKSNDGEIAAGQYANLTVKGDCTRTLAGAVTVVNALTLEGSKNVGMSDSIVTLYGDNKTLSCGSMTASYATINNVIFAAEQTVSGWEVNTNTVNGSGNTNLVIALGGTFSASVGASITYGETLKDNAEIIVTYSLRGQNATLNGETDDDTIYDAGTHTENVNVSAVGYTFSGNEAFDTSLIFTVNPKEVAVDWPADTVVYTYNGSDQDNDVTASYKDINGDTVSLTVAFSGQGTTFKNAGDYTAAASMTTADGNYTLTDTTCNLTMNRKQLTVSGITASSKVYDGTTDVALNWSNVAISGLCKSELLTIFKAAGEFANKDCGVSKRVDITSVQFSDGENGGLASNYTATTPITTTASITMASLTITAADVGPVDKVYDANRTASKTFTYATGIGDETVSLKASGTYNHKDVTNSAIDGEMSLSFNVSNGNYFINSSVDGVSGKITPAALTVTATAQTFVYGNTLDAKSYQTNGWVNGTPEEDLNGSLTATGTCSAAGFLTAGTEHRTDGSSLASSTGNYIIKFIDSAVMVNPLVLTHNVTVTANKVYDGTTDVVFTGGLTNVLSGDAVTLNAEYVYDTKDIGSAKTISATIWNISGTDAANYTLPAAGTFSGSIAEVPSVVVTTAEDIVDFYDNKISLREAISYAGTGTLGSVITFSDTIDWAVTPIELAMGELTIDKALIIEGTNVTIDAKGANRIFYIGDGLDTPVLEVKLTGLNLLNGKSTDKGGAIYNDNESLTLSCITFTSNNAENGGAIYNYTYGTITVLDSVFSSNSANVAGGAIYTEGYLSLEDTSLSENSSVSGGAVYSVCTMLAVTGSSFTENQAENGGAVVLDTAVDNGLVVVNISDSRFIGNTASGFGGAIYSSSQPNSQLDVAIVNSVIHSNSAKSCGGIYNTGAYVKTTVVNSTVSLNSGSQIINNAGNLYLINDAVIGTTGTVDAEIYNTGSISLYGVVTGKIISSGRTEWNLTTGAKAEDVFVSTDHAQTDLAIKPDGPAALNGTLAGNILIISPDMGNGDFYYLRNNYWYKAGDETGTITFDPDDKVGNYGLGSTVPGTAKCAYTSALNADEYGTPVSRMIRMDKNIYSTGAYAIGFKTLTVPEISLLSCNEKSMTVSWTADQNEPASYDLYLYEDSTMSNLLYHRTDLTKTDANSFTIDHLATGVSLASNTEYYLKIEAVSKTDTTWLPASDSDTLKTKGIVNIPKITAGENTAQEICFSWDVSNTEHIDHWTVQIAQGSKIVYQQNENDQARAANYTVSGLKSGTFYQVTVTAVVDPASSGVLVSASDSLQITTHAAEHDPPVIYDVTALYNTSNNAEKIDFFWTAVDGVSSYTVNVYEISGSNDWLFYSNNNVSDTHHIVFESNNPAFKIGKSFTMETEYRIEITPNGIERPGKGTASILIEPLKPIVSSVWSNLVEKPELTVSWNPAADAVSYHVSVYADAEGTQLILDKSVINDTSVTFSDLRGNEPLAEGTMYWIRVEALFQQPALKYTLKNEELLAVKTTAAPLVIDVSAEPATQFTLDVKETAYTLITAQGQLIESGIVAEGGITILGDEERSEQYIITADAASAFDRIYINGNHAGSKAARDIISIEGNADAQTYLFDSVQTAVRFDNVPDSAYGTGSVQLVNGAVIAYSGAKNVFVNSKGNDTFKIIELNSNINLNLAEDKQQTLDFSSLNYLNSPGIVMNMDSIWHQAAVVGQSGTLRTSSAIANIILSSGSDTVFGSANGTHFTDTTNSRNVVTLKGGDNSVDFNGTSTIIAGNQTQSNVINITNADYSVINLSKSECNNSVTLFGSNIVVNGGKGSDTVRVAGSYALLNMNIESAGDSIAVIGDNAAITAGSGNDIITLIGSNGYVFAGAGNDKIYLEDGILRSTGNMINGGDGDDMIIALYTTGSNTFYSGKGNDFVLAGSGSDTIYGNSGYNFLFGSTGADKIFGGIGRDILVANRTVRLDSILSDPLKSRGEIYEEVYQFYGALKTSWFERSDLEETLNLLGSADISDGKTDSLKRGGGEMNLFFETYWNPDHDLNDAIAADLLY